MTDSLERAESAMARRYPSCHQQLLAELVAELKAARTENKDLKWYIAGHEDGWHPQAQMSDIRTRLANELREHVCGYSSDKGFHCISIPCGWSGHDLDFPEHVADVLLSLDAEEVE